MTYGCSPATTPALNLLAATTALCLAWPAHAGRPLSVDDAGVDEVGHGHVEVWWEGQRGQPGTVYMAPAFTPMAGLELGAVLARDRNERHTLQGVQAKWLWSPAQEQGCNAGNSAGVVHRRQGAGQSAGRARAVWSRSISSAPAPRPGAWSTPTWAASASAASPGAPPGAHRWNAAGVPSRRTWRPLAPGAAPLPFKRVHVGSGRQASSLTLPWAASKGAPC